MTARAAGGPDALRAMMTIRAFETALAARKDHGFQLLSTGEEAVAAGLAANLDDDDRLLTGGRSIGPALACGVPAPDLMAELLGRVSGINLGRAGRGHISDPSSGFFGAHAVVGGNISIAAGVALANQLAGRPGIVAVLFGDGACGAGALHETLNIAALWSLPVLFVCNNNQLSVSTPRSEALAPEQLSDLARPFGIWARTVDGMRFEAVAGAIAEAAAHVRGGGGPAFVECLSARFASHSTTARETRPREALARLRQSCPIEQYAAELTAAGRLTAAARSGLEAEVAAAIAEAVAFAEASAYPDPAEVLRHVG